MLAVVAAEQEREAGEVVAERLGVVCLAADEAGQGGAELVVVGREPVVQELQKLGEFVGSQRVWHAGPLLPAVLPESQVVHQ